MQTEQLLGAHNAQFVGSVHIVLGVILWRNSLDRGLLTGEVKYSVKKNKMIHTHSNPILIETIRVIKGAMVNKSLPCFSAKWVASSLERKDSRVPCM